METLSLYVFEEKILPFLENLNKLNLNVFNFLNIFLYMKRV